MNGKGMTHFDGVENLGFGEAPDQSDQRVWEVRREETRYRIRYNKEFGPSETSSCRRLQVVRGAWERRTGGRRFPLVHPIHPFPRN